MATLKEELTRLENRDKALGDQWRQDASIAEEAVGQISQVETAGNELLSILSSAVEKIDEIVNGLGSTDNHRTTLISTQDAHIKLAETLLADTTRVLAGATNDRAEDIINYTEHATNEAELGKGFSTSAQHKTEVARMVASTLRESVSSAMSLTGELQGEILDAGIDLKMSRDTSTAVGKNFLAAAVDLMAYNNDV